MGGSTETHAVARSLHAGSVKGRAALGHPGLPQTLLDRWTVVEKRCEDRQSKSTTRHAPDFPHTVAGFHHSIPTG